MTGPELRLDTAPDGTRYRDLDGNGVMDPFEDPRRPVEERVEDLLARLSLEEKAGLMFHTVIEAGADGQPKETAGHISTSGTTEVVLGKRMNHFNVHALGEPRLAARWHNAVQRIAEQAPHGIPVTISTDPRHAFLENAGVSFAARGFSQWPEMLGLAALRDADAVRRFADVVRQEYLAVGIRAALHPVVDLATEPRWARQAQTFGQDPALTTELGLAYLRGLQGSSLGPTSVAGTAKHFPGGGPQRDGEDAHFPYGREQVYPGGHGEDHLRPFPALVDAGVAAVMPYYGLPVGLRLRGHDLPEVGFSYSREVVTDLLRGDLGFDGVVLSDWELVHDNHVGDQVLPARAWGVEHLDALDRLELLLDAGVDQFGGEECADLLVDLVRSGRVPESRLDASARRLLAVKFRLGLFDDPYVDEDEAARVVGQDAFREEGYAAQARSVTVLTNGYAGSGDSHRAGVDHQAAGVDHRVGGADHRAAGVDHRAARVDHRAAGVDHRASVDPREPTGPTAITRPVLPLLGGLRLYVEGLDPAVASTVGPLVDRPEEADMALVRIGAPFEPRDDLFLESWFHQGSLDLAPGFVVRMRRLAAYCPLVLDVTLDRPAVLTPLVGVATALTASYGASDAAWLDAVTGRIPPAGRLPFDLPRSMDQVRQHPEDVPGFGDPLFPFGHGLRIETITSDQG
ncbi:Beta-glycosidase [Nostocoides japonicum T1-X7]|uniref:beta-glucosidase n=1 Tax=Nostocoides japonicum T1-X7 TaxID=1194083 RepID=A0A077LV44_9MICO|nr:glycoside hydrolase family 3 N-terminal domain-containing protein [Tetrasphaera japonica]CCH77798.1 Beta-glycosidase [Tetrasphaera japonica T1-X7]